MCIVCLDCALLSVARFGPVVARASLVVARRVRRTDEGGNQRIRLCGRIVNVDFLVIFHVSIWFLASLWKRRVDEGWKRNAGLRRWWLNNKDAVLAACDSVVFYMSPLDCDHVYTFGYCMAITSICFHQPCRTIELRDPPIQLREPQELLG